MNTGGVKTYGVDTEINCRTSIDDHSFGVRLLLNYQPHLIYDLTPAPIVDVGGAADGVNVLPATPNVKGTLQVNYQIVDDVMATVQFRYRNGMKQNGNTPLIFVLNKIPPAWYADLNLSDKVKIGDADVNVFFNIRNVFNTPPKPWASTGGTGQIGTFGGWLQGDDPIGRYFKVGASYKL